jgi:hypothetical protein
MTEYQRIEYRILPNGTVTERVIESSGSSCVQATRGIEQALGKIDHQELLPEYYDDGDATIHPTRSTSTRPASS